MTGVLDKVRRNFRDINYAQALLRAFDDRPMQCSLYVTDQCNLDCGYCTEYDNSVQKIDYVNLPERGIGRSSRLIPPVLRRDDRARQRCDAISDRRGAEHDSGATDSGAGEACVVMAVGMVASCIEYASPADYAGAMGVCTALVVFGRDHLRQRRDDVEGRRYARQCRHHA